MPLRAVLNVVYRMATENMDSKERRTFDDKLYGFDKQNELANRELGIGGGES